MAGLCEGGNEPPGSLKASNYRSLLHRCHTSGFPVRVRCPLVFLRELETTESLLNETAKHFTFGLTKTAEDILTRLQQSLQISLRRLSQERGIPTPQIKLRQRYRNCSRTGLCCSRVAGLEKQKRIRKIATENIGMLWQAFNDDSLGKSQVYDWFSRFKSGNMSTEDMPRPGRHSTGRNAKIKRAIDENR
ncbi:hypothetical protein ANN_07996 [Periplaneta americana]|uniref:Mos1 transposase HTH domain-containing protein n=1 Tax=Periplaneta americana TaxID=6978 RepID=A0ABQ8T0U8_PERAM|nr:hypothetical protein ANN_07996 [Periplaneta americana]